MISAFKGIIMNYKKFIKTLQRSPKQRTSKKLNNFTPCIYTSFKMCRDNYVGTITTTQNALFLQKEYRYNNKNLLYKKSSTGKNKIVVLLESPHKDEYMFNIVAPALGETGEKLHTFLPKILLYNRLINSDESERYLVNCINYQCSLGYSTNLYRDLIFNFLWEKNKIKSSLRRRLAKISPNIIINAVTCKQKNKVSEFLLLVSSAELYEADTHPSVWGPNTKIQKIEK